VIAFSPAFAKKGAEGRRGGLLDLFDKI